MATFTCTQVFLMVGMLITGSIVTLCKKAENDCVVKGYKSEAHSFNHPWFQTWTLFIAQTLCLTGLPFQRRRELQENRKEITQNDLQSVKLKIETGPPVPARLCQWILIIPTCCSLIAVSLNNITDGRGKRIEWILIRLHGCAGLSGAILVANARGWFLHNNARLYIDTGLLYVDASIMLMLKGSIIIFAGIFSVIFLKRKLKLTHWLGMTIVIVGLVLAGCSSVFKSQDHKTIGGKTITGILLILSAQVVAGGQVIIEEAVLKKRNLHPLHVVGMKGIYGLIFMSFVVLPVLYFIPGDNVHGSYENSIDALYQISNSIQLLILCLLYTVTVAFYNYFSMAVVRSLTAVHSTLIDACRTILVWGAGLTIYYGFDKNFGEPFDKSYGILQIDGFLCLVIGTAIYKQLLDFRNFMPCRRDPKERNEQTETDHRDNVHNVQIRDNSEDEIDNENTKLLKENR